MNVEELERKLLELITNKNNYTVAKWSNRLGIVLLYKDEKGYNTDGDITISLNDKNTIKVDVGGGYYDINNHVLATKFRTLSELLEDSGKPRRNNRSKFIEIIEEFRNQDLYDIESRN